MGKKALMNIEGDVLEEGQASHSFVELQSPQRSRSRDERNRNNTFKGTKSEKGTRGCYHPKSTQQVPLCFERKKHEDQIFKQFVGRMRQ